jgi:hypothetical protein
MDGGPKGYSEGVDMEMYMCITADKDVEGVWIRGT